MLFQLIPYRSDRNLAAANKCFLVIDGWDDYTYKTLFQLIYFDGEGQRFDIGNVKIMTLGLEGRVQLPPTFEALPGEYCSLGQDQGFYETLLLVPEATRIEI